VKRKDYHGAIRLYTAALEQCQGGNLQAIVLTNRAIARAKVGQLQESYDDASMAVRHDPCWFKAYYRQAMALIPLGWCEQARVALLCVIALQPTNKEALTALKGLPLDEVGVAGAAPELAIAGTFLPPVALVLRLWGRPVEAACDAVVTALLSTAHDFISLFHGGEAEMKAYIEGSGCESPQRAEAVVRKLYGLYLEDHDAALPLPESVLHHMTATPTALWDEEAGRFKRLVGVKADSFHWLSAQRARELEDTDEEEEAAARSLPADEITWQVRMTTGLLPVGSVAHKWGVPGADANETWEQVFEGGLGG